MDITEDLEARVSSYDKAPSILREKRIVLAEAGFYYAGTGDRVKCFSCHTGFDWMDEDDPWKEHAKWSPECPFLRSMKDEEFIKAHQGLTIDENLNMDLEITDFPNYQKTLEEEDNSLFSDAVQSVILMGHAPKKVISAIETFKLTENKDQLNVTNILKAISDMEYTDETSNVTKSAKMVNKAQEVSAVDPPDDEKEETFLCTCCRGNDITYGTLCGHLFCGRCRKIDVRKCPCCFRKLKMPYECFKVYFA